MEVLHTPTMTLRSVRGDKSQYFNNADYVLINANDIPKFKLEPIDVSEAQDGSKMVDSAAMTLGITNIIQSADIPTLNGQRLDVKYWKMSGGVPVRMSQSERDAVDQAEVDAAAEAQKKHDDFEKAKLRRTEVSSLMARADAFDPDTATPKELAQFLKDVAPIVYRALHTTRTPVIEDAE